MGGVGSITKYPEAIVRLVAYEQDAQEPIWEELWAQGEPAETGIANTMGVSADGKKDASIKEATSSGMSALVARYRGETQK